MLGRCYHCLSKTRVESVNTTHGSTCSPCGETGGRLRIRDCSTMKLVFNSSLPNVNDGAAVLGQSKFDVFSVVAKTRALRARCSKFQEAPRRSHESFASCSTACASFQNIGPPRSESGIGVSPTTNRCRNAKSSDRLFRRRCELLPSLICAQVVMRQRSALRITWRAFSSPQRLTTRESLQLSRAAHRNTLGDLILASFLQTCQWGMDA